jgi:hypothetical protein
MTSTTSVPGRARILARRWRSACLLVCVLGTIGLAGQAPAQGPSPKGPSEPQPFFKGFNEALAHNAKNSLTVEGYCVGKQGEFGLCTTGPHFYPGSAMMNKVEVNFCPGSTSRCSAVSQLAKLDPAEKPTGMVCRFVQFDPETQKFVAGECVPVLWRK